MQILEPGLQLGEVYERAARIVPMWIDFRRVEAGAQIAFVAFDASLAHAANPFETISAAGCIRLRMCNILTGLDVWVKSSYSLQ